MSQIEKKIPLLINIKENEKERKALWLLCCPWLFRLCYTRFHSLKVNRKFAPVARMNHWIIYSNSKWYNRFRSHQKEHQASDFLCIVIIRFQIFIFFSISFFCCLCCVWMNPYLSSNLFDGKHWLILISRFGNGVKLLYIEPYRLLLAMTINNDFGFGT